MSTISQRIKEALALRNLKQSDLVELTGIGKSSISTYISGAYEPKQKNIYKIAQALNVDESWLMGNDVPMERTIETTELSKEQKELLSNYNKLNDKGKDKLIDYSNDLVENPKYTYEEPETFAAHSKENGDIEGNNRDIEKIKKLIMEDKSR